MFYNKNWNQKTKNNKTPLNRSHLRRIILNTVKTHNNITQYKN